jgi:hypothetical protein
MRRNERERLARRDNGSQFACALHWSHANPFVQGTYSRLCLSWKSPVQRKL